MDWSRMKAFADKKISWPELFNLKNSFNMEMIPLWIGNGEVLKSSRQWQLNEF